MSKPLRLNFPIFSIISHKDFILVSGGGGGKNYGVENKLAVYKKNTKLEQPVFELTTGEDIFENLTANANNNLISCNSGRFCVVFLFDQDKGSLSEITRWATDPDSQNCSTFTNAGDKLATGGKDPNIKIWKVEKKGDKNFAFPREKEIKCHTGSISHLDISPNDEMICSASEDKSCRIFSIKDGVCVKKLSFGEGDQNMKFGFCFFSRDEKSIITIQNPIGRGKSYLTCWDFETFEPVKTMVVDQNPISAACFSDEGLYIGLGTADGGAKILNTRYLEIDNEATVHDFITKSVSFVNDNRALCSVSPDYSFYFLPNVRKEGAFSKFSKMAIFIMMIVYALMWLNEKLGVF